MTKKLFHLPALVPWENLPRPHHQVQTGKSAKWRGNVDLDYEASRLG